jgi:hypothetical protein
MGGVPATARHLARRFAGSLLPGGPGPDDERWAAGVLTPAELAVWRRMPGPDRRHAVGVARRVDEALRGAPRAVVAAALLHDAGKIESGLGTLSRVPVTLFGLVGGRSRSRAWADLPGGVRWRVAAYLDHPARGAALLCAAGSDPLTVAWTAEHHLSPDRWSVPAAVGQVLAAADDG